jgi:hypothetical protein
LIGPYLRISCVSDDWLSSSEARHYADLKEAPYMVAVGSLQIAPCGSNEAKPAGGFQCDAKKSKRQLRLRGKRQANSLCNIVWHVE